MNRALMHRWQLELDRKVSALERELNQQMGDLLQQEIDREVLESVREQHLCQQGWHRVPAWVISRESQDVTRWLAENCRGRHERFCGRVVFELLEDAVAFAMVWA